LEKNPNKGGKPPNDNNKKVKHKIKIGFISKKVRKNNKELRLSEVLKSPRYIKTKKIGNIIII